MVNLFSFDSFSCLFLIYYLEGLTRRKNMCASLVQTQWRHNQNLIYFGRSYSVLVLGVYALFTISTATFSIFEHFPFLLKLSSSPFHHSQFLGKPKQCLKYTGGKSVFRSNIQYQVISVCYKIVSFNSILEFLLVFSLLPYSQVTWF